MIRIFFIIALLFCSAPPLLAMEAGESLDSPVQEKRARAIGDKLRCMVCETGSINDSPVDLAKDMRRLIREQIKFGASDQEILNYFKDRYGDSILLNPPLQIDTMALWLLPWLLLAFGLLFFLKYFKNKKNP